MSTHIPEGSYSAAFYLEGGVGTTPFVTTIGLQAADPGADPVDVANVAFAAYATNFMPSTSPQLTLTRVVLSVGQDGVSNPTVESNVPAVVGTGTGEYLPLSNALLLNKNTARLGRQGRGRMFIPGCMKDDQADISGRLGSTTVAAFNDVAQDFIDFLVDEGEGGLSLLPVLLHDFAVADDSPTPITAITVNPIVGTVRKRIK